MITAASATDSTKSASAKVTISGSATVGTLKGQYAFLIQAPTGNPTDRGITTFVGSVTLDGAGNVTGGMEDIVSPLYDDQGDPILATVAGQTPTSHYTVDASGHGTLEMLTMNMEDLVVRFVATSPSHALVIEADGNPGSGTMDLQTTPFSASQISGNYSFTLTGINAMTTPAPELAFGGILSVNSTSNSITGTMDIKSSGSTPLETDSITAGSIDTGPDPATGRGTFHFVPLSPGLTRTFVYFVVSPKVLRLLETDGQADMGGSACAQGSATTSLSGNYVYQHSGWNPASAVPPTGFTVAAGEFSVAAGSTTFSGGVSDANTGAAPPTSATTGVAISNGSYSISTTLEGTLALTEAAGSSTFNMYMVDPTLNILDPNNTTGGGGALLLHTDANITGTGVLLPQSAPVATMFTGNYALDLQNSIATATPDELDLVGVFTSDGTANFTNGLADYNQNSTVNSVLMAGAALTGTFAADTTHAGHSTGTITVTPPVGGYSFVTGATSATAAFNASFYQVSASQAFVIETDTQANVAGVLVQVQLP
ncbi:MAG: hypothetical protein WBL63_18870 [Candidatus Acidiferrum sp.]